MAGLPQLNEEDVDTLDAALDTLLQRSEATAALIIDKGGPLISQRGAVEKFDTTTISALAGGAFCATEAISQRLGETCLEHIYQQGRELSLLISNVDENLLIVTIFPASLSVGAVKYYATDAVARIAAQMQKAALREPARHPGPGFHERARRVRRVPQIRVVSIQLRAGQNSSRRFYEARGSRRLCRVFSHSKSTGSPSNAMMLAATWRGTSAQRRALRSSGVSFRQSETLFCHIISAT